MIPATVLSENLERAVNDSSRHVTIRGKEVIVPLKFDKDGNPATVNKFLFKRLTINDLRFLKTWREAGWDIEKAVSASGLERSKAEKLVKKLACFRDEDAKVRALCEIPTPDWIAAKHVENLYAGGVLEDSQHKSLAELAKIEGAYKTQANVSITQNVFNLPKMDAETEAKIKALADNAIDVDVENVA